MGLPERENPLKLCPCSEGSVEEGRGERHGAEADVVAVTCQLAVVDAGHHLAEHVDHGAAATGQQHDVLGVVLVVGQLRELAGQSVEVAEDVRAVSRFREAHVRKRELAQVPGVVDGDVAQDKEGAGDSADKAETALVIEAGAEALDAADDHRLVVDGAVHNGLSELVGSLGLFSFRLLLFTLFGVLRSELVGSAQLLGLDALVAKDAVALADMLVDVSVESVDIDVPRLEPLCFAGVDVSLCERFKACAYSYTKVIIGGILLRLAWILT